MKHKIVKVLQHGYKDCASACLLSIIKYYGFNMSMDELSLMLKTGREGTSAYNIVNTAKTLGFNSYGVRGNNMNEIVLPAIIHTIKDGNYHYMVLYKYTDKYVILMDPSIGICKKSITYFNNIYNNVVIALIPNKKIYKVNKYKSFNKYILEELFNNKILIIINIFLSIIITLLSIFFSLYFKYLFDFNVSSSIIICFIIISLFKNILLYIKNKIIININYKINNKIFNNFINKFFNLPYLFFKNKSTSEVTSRIYDLSYFNRVIYILINDVPFNIMLYVLCSIFLIKYNIKLYIISIVICIVYILFNIFFRRIINNKFNDYKDNEYLYNKYVYESVNCFESFKNINIINSVIDKLRFEFNNKNIKENNYNIILSNKSIINEFFLEISSIIIMNNLFNNNISIFFIYYTLYNYIISSVKNVVEEYSYVCETKDIYYRINDLIIMNNNATKSSYKAITGDISVKDLSYSYCAKNAVSDVSFNIKSKDKVLIYGKSGVGKSTIFKIFMKYLTEYNGSILINNCELKDISDVEILNNITYVSQNDMLINDTIKNNIILNRNISLREYNNIIDICNLRKLIDSNKDKDGHIICDNGFNISGGERQKIILARALLKKSIILILDESLSMVDSFEEIEIIKKINKYFSDKTIIYSSHKKVVIDFFNNKILIERSTNG